MAEDHDVLRRWDRRGEATAWRSWGDEVAVYDGATGATHLLTAPAGRLWRLLVEADAPRAEAELLRDLAAAGFDADAETLRQWLDGLAAVGLARPAAH